MNKKEDIEILLKILPDFSERVLESYANLPLDNYLEQDQVFRQRRFSKIRFENSKSNSIDEASFYQANAINHYAGGLERVYEPLETEIYQEFIELYQNHISPVFYNRDAEIGFHQIRITCDDHYVGHPVPEGWHTDGFDYVAIACISGLNFSGGTSRLKSDIDSDHDFFTRILQPSELILFNDHKYLHHTDPINNRIEGTFGYRDILVITISHL